MCVSFSSIPLVFLVLYTFMKQCIGCHILGRRRSWKVQVYRTYTGSSLYRHKKDFFVELLNITWA